MTVSPRGRFTFPLAQPNKQVMSIYQKQNLQVQFLKFGVDHNGIIVPILKRGKDNFVQLPSVARSVNAQNKNTPRSR